MVIFNSYVKLPEGSYGKPPIFFDGIFHLCSHRGIHFAPGRGHAATRGIDKKRIWVKHCWDLP